MIDQSSDYCPRCGIHKWDTDRDGSLLVHPGGGIGKEMEAGGGNVTKAESHPYGTVFVRCNTPEAEILEVMDS